MTDSPRIVPISKSTTAHELLGALTGLSVIGALRAYDGSEPESVALDSFWESRRELAVQAFQVAQYATGLGDETASMFDEFWKPPSDDALLWLVAYAGMRVDPGKVGISDLAGLAVRGLYRQLHEFIIAMIRGAGERNPREKSRLDSVRQAAFLGAELGAADDPSVAANRAYLIWSTTLADLLNPKSRVLDSRKIAIRDVADVLDELFDVRL